MAQSKQAQNRTLMLISGFCRKESNDMNIINGIIIIIFEYQKHATWSKIYKGDDINLSEDDSKATCIKEFEKEAGSIRANFCIKKGETISWEFEFYKIWGPRNFVGVVSSKVTDFNANPTVSMIHAYGIDDGTNRMFNGDGLVRTQGWKKPTFPSRSTFNMKVIADWTLNQCKLTFVYNGQKLNKTIDGYTILLPPLDDDIVLYPCATPYNKDAYCIIRFV